MSVFKDVRHLLALAAGVSLAVLLAGSAGAFAPTNLRSLGSQSHESITRSAVTALDQEFFSVSSPTRTMKKAMDQIVDANAAVDGDQTHSALHFDGENFAGGQSRVVDLFNRTIADVRAKNAQAARADLGGALHTIQDFYAHSNWIELGNTGPNPDLGRPGHTIGNVAGPTEPTCNGSTLTTTKLTSGYYGGEDARPAIPTKCRHGGPFDSGPGTGGINKDFRINRLSPHSAFHDAAAAAAEQATRQFIRDIKAQITEPQLRLLLGAGPTLGMAIDTTGSMGSIIEGVKTQADAIVDARVGTDEEPAKYVLSPFNDPGTGPTTVTDDPDQFKAAIGALFASGGDDCPELSMTGMLQALSEMDKGGDLFMFTDASSKDESLAGNVDSLAQANEVTVYPVLFGSCSPIDPGYIRIANDTGGQVFVLSRGDAGSITKLADFVVRSNGVDVLNVAGDLSTGAKTFTVPVDSTMSRVTFSSSGASSMTVVRPDGTTVHAGDPGVDTVTPSGGFVPASILTVAGPAVGTWTVSLGGGGEFSLNVTGVSTLDLSTFRFVHEVPGHGGPFDLPLPGLPPAGRPSTADAFVSGPFASAAFDLRSRAGDVLQTLALTAVSDPAAGEFTGDVTPPGTPFRVYVTGKDLAGNDFQRAVPAVIQPQVVVVTPPASSELRPGQTSSFPFQVQNLGGASDTFLVSVSDDKGYRSSPATQTLTLGPNETGTITVDVQPPGDAVDGTSDTISVDVSSTTSPDVRNFAVLTNSVVAAPPDTTAPTTTATVTPAPNSAGWNSSDVTVSLHAVDNDGGSGVRSITYGSTTVSGDAVSIPITTEGVTTLTFSATDNAGNAEAPQTLTVKLDKTAPTLTCRAVPSRIDEDERRFVPVNILVSLTDTLSAPAGFELVSATVDPPSPIGGDIVGFTTGGPDVSGSVRVKPIQRNGRVYTFTYEGADVAGNDATCAATVTVAHGDG